MTITPPDALARPDPRSPAYRPVQTRHRPCQRGVKRGVKRFEEFDADPIAVEVGHEVDDAAPDSLGAHAELWIVETEGQLDLLPLGKLPLDR